MHPRPGAGGAEVAHGGQAVNELSDREVNLIVAAVELVAVARRGGERFVPAWHDRLLSDTATPAPSDAAELAGLRRKLRKARSISIDTGAGADGRDAGR